MTFHPMDLHLIAILAGALAMILLIVIAVFVSYIRREHDDDEVKPSDEDGENHSHHAKRVIYTVGRAKGKFK